MMAIMMPKFTNFLMTGRAYVRSDKSKKIKSLKRIKI